MFAYVWVRIMPASGKLLESDELCFTGSHYVCSVVTDLKIKIRSGVYAVFRLGTEMLGGGCVESTQGNLCIVSAHYFFVYCLDNKHDLCVLQLHGYYKHSTYPSLQDFNESITHHIT